MKFNEILQEIARLREEQNRLRQDMVEGFKKFDITISAIGSRWGIIAEDAFREGIKAVLEELEGYRIERWNYFDEEGYVHGYPTNIEVDIAVSNGKVILMEIKSNVRASDVTIFKRKVELYNKVTGKSIDRKIIVTPFIEHDGKDACIKHRVEIYSSKYIKPYMD